MYKLTFVVIALSVLLLGSLAYGQGYYGQSYEQQAYNAWRARAGYYDLGDAGSDLGFGVDYTSRQWLASFDYVTTEQYGEDFDIWSVSGSWLWRRPAQPGTYYGAGLGWYDVTVADESDDDIGYHVLVGTQFGSSDQFGEPAWFAEARYVLGTGFDGGDIDGFQLYIGRRF